jgi:hypothetical protein
VRKEEGTVSPVLSEVLTMHLLVKHLSPMLSLGGALVIAAAGCGRSRGPDAGLFREFTITNAALGEGSTAWLIQATNGISWVIEKDRVSLVFGVENSLNVDFSPGTRTPTKIVLETPNTQSGPGAWVVDLNADGVPDTRRTKGNDGTEVFWNGKWYWTEVALRSNTVVTSGGSRVSLLFDGTNWQQAAAQK